MVNNSFIQLIDHKGQKKGILNSTKSRRMALLETQCPL